MLNTLSSKVGCRLGVSLGLLLCSSGWALAQQTAIANGSIFGNFTLQCEAETIQTVTCALVQTIVAADDQRFLAEIGVNLGVRDNTGTVPTPLTLVMRTPSSMRLSVSPAYVLRDATEEVSVPWLTCAGDFCLAAVPLDDGALAALSAAPSMTTGYLPLGTTAPVSFDVALDGLAQGLRALGLFPNQ